MAEITAQPKPTYQIDGQLVAWGDYLAQLQRTVDWCNEHLATNRLSRFDRQAYHVSNGYAVRSSAADGTSAQPSWCVGNAHYAYVRSIR